MGKLTALKVQRLADLGMHADGGGLYLQVTAGGAKPWIYRFTLAGKAREVGLGSLSALSLVDVRDKAAECRRLRAEDVDPVEARNAARTAEKAVAAKIVTFVDAADLFIASHEAGWRNEKHAISDMEAVKGTAPVKPPLTIDGEHALREIATNIALISREFEDLSERASKGLAFEARRHSTFEDEQGLWAGVAEAADRRREIQARLRTGKGTWYAIVEGWVAHPTDKHMASHVDIASERREGKKAAVEAARRLLKEHADRFSDTVTIEASVKCELKWKPLSDE